MKKLFTTIASFVVGLMGAGGLYLRQVYLADKRRRLHHLRSEMKTFTTDDGTIEYQVVGQGRPILVFHGLLGTFEHGRNAMWKFDRDTYQLIAVSRPGYELDAHQPSLTSEQYLSLLASLLDHLDIETVAVVAMSAGGPIGIRFAADYSDRVDTLILLEALSKACEVKRSHLLTVSGLLMRTLKSDPLAWLASEGIVRSLPLVSRFSTDTRERIVKYPERRDLYTTIVRSFFPTEFMTAGYDEDVRVLRDMPVLPFENITCPTLILHGDADEVVPIDHSQASHEGIADAQFQIIGDGADHDFHITHAEPVWNAIFNFLKSDTMTTHTTT